MVKGESEKKISNNPKEVKKQAERNIEKIESIVYDSRDEFQCVSHPI